MKRTSTMKSAPKIKTNLKIDVLSDLSQGNY